MHIARIILVLPLLLSTAAAAPAGERVTHMTIAIPIEGRMIDGPSTRLPRQGLFCIHTQARWEWFANFMTDLGARDFDKDAFAEVDFEKEMIVGAIRFGSAAAAFEEPMAIRGNAPGPAGVLFVVHEAPPQPSTATRPGEYRIILHVVQRTDVRDVEVHWDRLPVGQTDPNRTPILRGKVGPAIGDTLDGLSASIEPQQLRVKAGEDIAVKMRLVHRTAQLNTRAAEPVQVWDGKYSRGYRNHAFEVHKPDGSVIILRAPERGAVDKDAPHLVDILPDRPYVIPSWTEVDAFHSLKGLGLDTTKPGVYRIVGWYDEEAGMDTKAWRGHLTSNAVAVEVIEP
jgi:hypothetical protein